MPTDIGEEARGTGRWLEEVKRIARRVRLRVLAHTIKHNGGYLSQACSAAEILATLYTHVMKLGPSLGQPVPRPFVGVPGQANRQDVSGALYNGPRAPDLDRFFFSPAHYALVLYATLIEVGRLAPEALEQFNRDGSTLEMIGAEHSPGMELTTGSLSQALSQAGGVALARRLRGEPGRCWVFMSDGELQEGQTWEAVAALAFHRLDNLAVYVDINGQQCDGRMETVMAVEPVRARLEAFGARVVEVDGHDPEALAAPAPATGSGRPLFVLARTDPCRGLDVLRARAPKLHYVRFRNEEERRLFEEAYAKLAREVGLA
ncbi:transketolase [Nitrospira sp. Kam-Ns4a]